MILSPPDVRLWRKSDSKMKEDDCAPPALIRVNKEKKIKGTNKIYYVGVNALN